MSHFFKLTPRDVLFFRNARPMEASDAGEGANWPRPDQLYNAIHNAFLRQWPETQPWEGLLHTFRDKRDGRYTGISKDKNRGSSLRFGALKTFGPFPLKKDGSNDRLFFPCPLDWGMKLVKCEGTDLPFPLSYAFLPKEEGKASFPAWIPCDEYQDYLNGKDDPFRFLADRSPNAPADWKPYEKAELFEADRNIGIAIDPNTGTTVEHQFYQAEYLRLADDVTMAYEAECNIKPKGGNGATVDVFAQPGSPRDFVFGGQQGLCRSVEEVNGQRMTIPALPSINGPLVRWTLLTPAVFANGWLPGWCKDSRKIPDDQKSPLGTVMLKGNFHAKLIAARIGKPTVFSGWDLQSNAPKPTTLAVPAGSSYVFQCESTDEAKALATVLDYPNRRSDLYGEKGFGIGICSNISID